jgi:hypothetical protein
MALEALETATKQEADVFTVILIERSILRFAERTEGRALEELSAGERVRLPSLFGVRLPLPRRDSSVMPAFAPR